MELVIKVKQTRWSSLEVADESIYGVNSKLRFSIN